MEIICDDFTHFMEQHREVDGVVSPANCFGIMDGGYDAAITTYFWDNLMKEVQKKILEEYRGIQPIATCISVDIKGFKDAGNRLLKLLHTLIMTTPGVVLDPALIYHAMRNTMMEAIKCNLENMVLPAWGGNCGAVPRQCIAYYMRKGYDQVSNPNQSIDWKVMERVGKELCAGYPQFF